MSEDRTVAYSSAITAAMRVISLRLEIDELKQQIRSLLTYEELVGEDYKDEFVGAAFEKAEVGVEPASHVKSQCALGDARVYLHDHVNKLTGKAMAYVINEARPTK